MRQIAEKTALRYSAIILDELRAVLAANSPGLVIYIGLLQGIAHFHALVYSKISFSRGGMIGLSWKGGVECTRHAGDFAPTLTSGEPDCKSPTALA